MALKAKKKSLRLYSPLKRLFSSIVLKRRNLRLVFLDIHPAGTKVGRREVQIAIVIPIAPGQCLGVGLDRNRIYGRNGCPCQDRIIVGCTVIRPIELNRIARRARGLARCGSSRFSRPLRGRRKRRNCAETWRAESCGRGLLLLLDRARG